MSKLSGKTVGAYAGLTHHARVVINYSMFVIYLAAGLI